MPICRVLVSCALAAVGCCGCAAYYPAPLQPANVARQFQHRSLADPALCQYLADHLGPEPPACPPSRWGLAALTLAGWYYNPAMAVAAARVREADAAVLAAGARPNPSVHPGLQYDVRSSPSFAPWALGMFSLSIPVQTAGKRGARVAQAQRLADAARIGAGETAWSVRRGIRAALLQYLLDRRGSALALAAARVIAEAADLIAQRVRAGEAARPQLNLALAEVQSSRVKAIQAQARVPVDRSALAAAVGITAQALNGMRFSWPSLDRPPRQSLSADSIQRLALLDRLDLRRELAQYAAADDNLKLEIARQYPDISFPAGYSWEGGENIFELGLGLTLPIFNQNQGPIREAETRRQRIAAQFLAMQAGVIAQARAALIAYRGSLSAFNAARAAAKLQAERLDQLQRAVAAGENDSLTLAAARLQDLAARQTLLGALSNTQIALGALEDSIQRPLDGGALGRFSFPPPRNLRRGGGG